MKCSNTNLSSFKELYNDGYIKSQLDKFLNRKTNHWAARIEKVFKDLSILELTGKKVLDLGTSIGTYAYEFAERGYEVSGIDLSEQSIAVAKRIARQEGKDIRYIIGDVSEVSNFNQEFDLIYAGDIIEHLSEDLLQKTIDNCYFWLKAGGKFMFHTVPMKYDIIFHKTLLWVMLVPFSWLPDKIFKENTRWLYQAFGAIFKLIAGKSWRDWEKTTVHCNLQTKEGFLEILKRANFEILSVDLVITESRFRKKLKMFFFSDKEYFQKDMFGVALRRQ